MKQDQKQDRKKFLAWGAAILGVISLPPIFRKVAKNPTIACAPGTKKVKMLTRDGKLVEIDEKLLASASHKASNEEMKNWVEKQKMK